MTSLTDDAVRNPIIDCHAHIFSADMPVTSGAWITPDYAFTADDLLARMDAHGIHFAVISALSISGSYNDYLISELRRHKRLRGTAIVPPGTDFYVLERMRDDGIIGIRLQLARAEYHADYRSDEYRLLFRRARDLGWHVHVAIEGQNLPPVLDALVESGVDIVIDHFGHPDPQAPLDCVGFRAMLDAVDKGHTWVKLSGGFRLPGPEAWRDDPDGDLESLAQHVADHLVSRVGTDRLLWGSDAPFVGYERRIGYEQVLASYRRWVPDPAQRAQICRTALKLYFS
ncbi:putative TIM-barrel fold metal-dependent hydrolase [Sphingobium sp. B11D3B]|uniref:amidohydrolase family protein n=1 Tax=unclassified Sphingobium TaxID=2611147 RepID=UPI00222457BC|nr:MULTISPECIES: amidohydrolase family protein [unclassified Sphingobium]MCW2351062.1 putative TIM-barrel fold metal-dependent hydrolase [Sphingobium sp. B12D2B]MCW2370278.1 putative TIM-barrel fold metal-dependent hydrolase [Sphingobium sp. B11D3D]MCW2388727.1 putative TIM-barrel fold metal-dependent hydrolase [Sphingobium sp. B11D3B]MCW2411417.1 putative TIM-barrel fold metal-dependent hydrolase [Sphingobium sp. B8D3D]MCW2416290.1 putative TIM-barrel fold metal-dependent hydrolase [Sphingobi